MTVIIPTYLSVLQVPMLGLMNGTELRKKVAQNVRRIREKKGLTLDQAATRMGISRRGWSFMETTKGTNTCLENLARVAKALGVQPWRLLK